MKKFSDMADADGGSPNLRLQVEGKIYTISELTSEIKQLLVENFGLESFWIKGEISNYRGRNAQGHIYFKLKDEKAVISVAFFSYANKRLSFDLEEGMQVFAYGKIGLYEPQGSYQFIIEEIRPSGLGDLFLKFENLKKKLAAEGLFDPERKKKIPYIPEKVGIITSPTGAALRDMLRILKNRLPSIPIVIFPVRVQGEEAKDDIEKAINLANKKEFDIDVIILGRGGGSIEELWAFNEENVARAISKSKVPIISAVGHETDFTISDFVADLRAATPSNAAELVVPDIEDLKHRISVLFSDIISSIKERTNLYQERIRGFLRNEVLRDPMTILRTRQQILDNLIENSKSSLRFKLERVMRSFHSIRETFISRVRLSFKSYEGKIEAFNSALSALNPHAVLERGYSIAMDINGKIIKSHRDVEIKDKVSLTLKEGELGLEVIEKSQKRGHARNKDK